MFCLEPKVVSSNPDPSWNANLNWLKIYITFFGVANKIFATFHFDVAKFDLGCFRSSSRGLSGDIYSKKSQELNQEKVEKNEEKDNCFLSPFLYVNTFFLRKIFYRTNKKEWKRINLTFMAKNVSLAKLVTLNVKKLFSFFCFVWHVLCINRRPDNNHTCGWKEGSRAGRGGGGGARGIKPFSNFFTKFDKL